MEWSINYMLGSLIHIAQLLKNPLLLIIISIPEGH
jgi:hypothetical protein